MENQESYIVQLSNLSIGYGKPLLSSINAELKAGEIVLLAGKNGSGKTTLLKTLFKELPILKGSISINSKELSKISLSDIGKQLAVVLSKSLVSPSLKVYDLIALGRYPYKRWYQKLTQEEIKNIEDLIGLLKLEKYRNYYVSQLSDGNLQKVLIARALIQDCPLLILDEPTSFLDVSNKLEVINLLKYLGKEKGKTIIFTSHDLNLGLNIADKLWLIKEDEVITGFTEDIAERENILDYFAGGSALFDFNSNGYNFYSHDAGISVFVMGDMKTMYWLKKALNRYGIQIKEESDVRIIRENQKIKLRHGTCEYFFSSIQELVSYLIKLKKN